MYLNDPFRRNIFVVTLVCNVFPAEISIVVCDKEERSLALMNDKNEMPTLKIIVQVEPISDVARKKAREIDLDLLSFKEMEVSYTFPLNICI